MTNQQLPQLPEPGNEKSLDSVEQGVERRLVYATDPNDKIGSIADEKTIEMTNTRRVWALPHLSLDLV